MLIPSETQNSLQDVNSGNLMAAILSNCVFRGRYQFIRDSFKARPDETTAKMS